MDYQTVMLQLEQLGTEQTRKTYRRHGLKDPMFGVSYAGFATLTKKIKRNHALAQTLWQSGNSDARLLAMMVADPAQTSMNEFEHFANEADSTMIADEVAKYTAGSIHALELAARWIDSESEFLRRIGWNVYGQLCKARKLPEALASALLSRIEKEIHFAPNKAREAMNSAIIAIGSINTSLHQQAIAAGQRIGPVSIDHGDTNCKTPNAVAYLQNERLIARLK